jgi:hydroxyacylglutathione hydrolase
VNTTSQKLSIELLTVGQMAANCYLVQDRASGEILIIDPGEDANYIAEHVMRLQGKPVAVLATHGHFDHILGARELQLTFDIPFRIHTKDTFLVARMQETAAHFLGRTVIESPPVVDSTFSDMEKILLGESELMVLETPGHTPGSTIFAQGGVGRTDFSYSEPLKLSVSLDRILEHPSQMRLLPGHGEETTVHEAMSLR